MTNLSRSKSLTKLLGGRNLYLVGMMGSGKSSTGPYLAKLMQYGFVDQDDLIEQVAKKSIAQIFGEEGESNFRDIETQVLKEIGKRHSLVISTGGGVVLRSENWGILHQGIVIWINTSREKLLKRLEFDQTNRPLLKTHDIDLILKERHRFYAESDLQIFVEDESPEEVAFQIFNKLPNIINNQDD
ncbi:shikimate kinase [Prochlorococcus marinus]|uniref:shikimate kinase n=1 Tax=Prochlorococcus marinus TaxID=1219 RepID=UPI0022B2F210|nr:shikimate kinase [Prochlorococcus marinus]